MRLLQRLWRHIMVFLLGVVTVWLIVFVVFQVTDNTLPWIVAVAVTYGLAAYIILPRAIRMGLKVLHRQHVPQYTTTGDGLPADPVNIALIGTLRLVISMRQRIGQEPAGNEPLALFSVARHRR